MAVHFSVFGSMKIVLDTCIAFGDEIFRHKVASGIYIGASWIPILYEQAEAHGIEVVLASKYLEDGQFYSEDLFVSEGINANTGKLLSTAAKPFILFSGESPNVDWKFYTFIKRHSKAYKYAFLFSGCKCYIHETTNFLPLHWPSDSSYIEFVSTSIAKDNARKLVMIAGNKKQSSMKNGGRLKGLLKSLSMKFLTTCVPSTRLKDLYSFRMDAIKYFSHKKYFDLYGRNWNDNSNLSKAENDAVLRLCPQEVSNKYEVLGQYQFALCFENCIYPGYITEKIFDCFLAKCIPVYLGAPDIEKFVPADLFIDMRQFSDFNKLHEFIISLKEKERQEYLDRIDSFLHSGAFQTFTDKHFAQTVLNLAVKENAQQIKN